MPHSSMTILILLAVFILINSFSFVRAKKKGMTINSGTFGNGVMFGIFLLLLGGLIISFLH